MSVVPTLPPTLPSPDLNQVGGADQATSDLVKLAPIDPSEAEAFRVAHADAAEQTQALPRTDAHGLFPDMAGHIDQLSTEMNDWFRSPGLEGTRLGAGVGTPMDPAAQMQELYALVSKQFINNTMLSMKLNVTNQEMEAVNKDKDQLMRGGS